MSADPLTLGTAGHIDHGKTALVRALTGVDTDRLPAERARGISIELGYAPLVLDDGRRLSVIDVPGHERFVRTMVAGATGIDLFLLVVAADDGVMPQTVEHVAVLAALGVTHGVVAVTRSDLADPADAAAAARELVEERLPASGAAPSFEVVACSGRTGAGVDEVRAALTRAAARVPSRAAEEGPAVLHVDRAFTMAGAGTVVTGTLWAGTITRGDMLTILPARREARVRGVEVHGVSLDRAPAGQRVAVNLARIGRDEIGRGDVLAAPGAPVTVTYRIDAALTLAPGHHAVPSRVQVHHGTREAAARLVPLGANLWQARLSAPLLVRRADRVVIRSIAPPDTLGGGVVLDPEPARHRGGEAVVRRLERIRRGDPVDDDESPAPPPPVDPGDVAPAAPEPAAALSAAALELEARLRASGHEPPRDAELGPGADKTLAELRAAGRVVRLGPTMHAHVDAIAAVRERVIAMANEGRPITLAGLRDELSTSRKYAQALLEHLDAARVTVRRPDDSRLLRRGAAAVGASPGSADAPG